MSIVGTRIKLAVFGKDKAIKGQFFLADPLAVVLNLRPSII
ncbi:uncharacterized protein METZ01_LOCUS21410 [marine metagenome]|uniref:Uncharacterized protein n=1 Tax=marine metagenome TaxID=408172 RepID=A0A381PNF1_9ZZZZ